MNYWDYNKKVGIELIKSFGNTNTDPNITNRLITSFVNFEKNKEIKILEPAVGTGSFYFSILDIYLKKGFDIKNVVENIIYGFDIDSKSIDKIKQKLFNEYSYKSTPQTKLYTTDFLLHEFNELKFDYIITNPPYISSKNIESTNKNLSRNEYIKQINEKIDLKIDKKSDIYIYFYIKSMNLLKENGSLVFLCSDSWIDSGFGESLKNKLFEENFNIELILNSQIYPFFRDDTNAILTVIKKTKNRNKTKIFILRDKIENINDKVFFEIEYNTLKKLMYSKEVFNKRNALILYYDTYMSILNFIEKNKKIYVKNKDIFNIETTSISQSFLQKNNIAYSLNNETNVNDELSLFWQIQARTNKKPLYKNLIKNSDLDYKIKERTLNEKLRKNIKSENVYLSSIIDRFPLLFFVKNKTFHCSKYISLNSDKYTQEEIVVSLNNIFSLLSFECFLKEGTRKTLRKGEAGLAKEIKKSDLLELTILPFNNIELISDEFKKFKNKIIYNIEHAILDEDYWNMQLKIADYFNLNENIYFVTKNLVFLYVLRMRNIEKINNFENYFNDKYGHLFNI